MKQHITIEQWNELSEKAKDILIPILRKTKDCKEGRGYAEATTIGRMIGFLGWDDMEIYQGRGLSKYMQKKYPERVVETWLVQDGDYENAGQVYEGTSICDALWSAVKNALDKWKY